MEGIFFSFIVLTISVSIVLCLPVKKTKKSTIPVCPRVSNSDRRLKDALKYLDFVPYEDE